MAWIELHQSVWTHRKTFALADELGIDEMLAAAYMIRLWCWALDNAPDGDLTNISRRAIARGAGWQKDPETFLAAAIKAGYIDQDDDGLRLHDWEDYAGRLIERRMAARERAARRRQMLREQYANGTHTVREPSKTTVPNHTVPNQTDDDHTHDQPPPGGGRDEAPKEAQKRQGQRIDYPADFEEFWKAYPRKVGKGAALRAWQAIKAPRPILDELLAALERQKQSMQWQREGGRFIPYPTTWLNQRRWEDETDDPPPRAAPKRNLPRAYQSILKYMEGSG